MSGGNNSEEVDGPRLTAATAKAVVRIATAWRASNAEAAALLGVTESTWDTDQSRQVGRGS